MFKPIQYYSDGHEIYKKVRLSKEYLKSTLVKVMATFGLIFIALSITIILYSVSMEQLVTAKHIESPKQPEEIKYYETTGVSEINGNTHSNILPSIYKKHHKFFKLSKRRLIRSLDLLNPRHVENQRGSLKHLYNKARSKRTKFILLKLENEYRRCKKDAIDSKDCVLLFLKMYNIAKEFSEKMEALKDTLQDNTETDENSKDDSKDKPDMQVKSEKTKSGTGFSGNKSLQITVKPLNETFTINLPIKSKIKPSKISWIIDGNDDYDNVEESEDIQNIASDTSFVGTSSTTTPEQESTNFFQDIANPSWTLSGNTTVGVDSFETTSLSFNAKSNWPLNGSYFTDSTSEANSFRNETTNANLHSNTSSQRKLLPSLKESEDEIFTFSESSIDNKSTTTPVDEDKAVLRKMKFDWILDGNKDSDQEYPFQGFQSSEMASAEIVSDQQTLSPDNTLNPYSTPLTVELPQPKENKNSPPNLHISFTLINSTGMKNVQYGESCNTPDTLRVNISKDCLEISKESNDSIEKERLDTHPLDDPSSAENMLENEERYVPKLPEVLDYELQEILTTTQITDQDLDSEALSTINPYDAKEWEKKFQTAAAEQYQDSLIEFFDDVSNKSFVPKLNSANLKNFKDSEFMTICEKMAKKLRNKSNLGNIGENETENFTPSPNIQFTSRGPGGFPVTGETMKASAQFMFNPSFGMASIPVCFFINPSNIRVINQMWAPSYFGMSGYYGGGNNFMAGPAGGSGGPGGIFFVPQNFGTTGQFFGHSGGSTGGAQANMPNIFSKNASPQKQHQQFFCTYMQSQNNNQNQVSGPGSSGGTGNVIGFSNANFKMRTSNKTTNGDIIYASYRVMPQHLGHEEHFNCRLPNQIACYGGNECIRQHSWCDGRVDCLDGSDEATCTCRDRLIPSRLCDGFADCPMGEDEIGCFGCDDFMYSCYDNEEEFQKHNRSVVSMCFHKFERCDGIFNCLNQRDEWECSIIANDISHHMSHSVSASEGYLYRNYKGDWYPVCNNGEKWAKEACENEGGLEENPRLIFKPLKLSGPFIEPSMQMSIHFPQNCQRRESQDSLVDHIAYVTCAPTKCGIRKPNIESSPSKRTHLLKEVKMIKKDAERESGIGRIVGGDYAEPLQWPFVVAMYRNGNFHCGGTIYSELWVISAAHCVINYWKYYYEVRAGVLRRTSFSLSTQIRQITHIIVHQGYLRGSMRNDLSLLRVEKPFFFNRWVKPICLPDMGRSTMGSDWIWGPEENTTCTTVGWGAIREKGPGSDHLRQVAVPIRKFCTEREDQESEDICAGDIEGGRDACQGDSGGPLFCQSVANIKEWFLAGVVSHGNGCARPGEFGVYTRVALYLDWINLGTKPKFLPKMQPLQLCPGFVCVWGGKRCIPERKRCDRIVECLGGEDEVGCTYNFIPDLASTKNSTTFEGDYTLDETTVDSVSERDIETTLLSEDANASNESVLNYELNESSSSETLTKFATTTEIDSFSIIEEVEGPIDSKGLKDSHDLSVKLIESVENCQTTDSTVEPTNRLDVTPFYNELVEETNSTISTTTDFMAKNLKLSATMVTLTEALSTTSLPVAISTEKEEAKDPINSTWKATITTESETIIQTIAESTEESVEKSLHTFKIHPQKFFCTKMMQSIDWKHRCDRVFDCEDGTDEENCTCRDYLKTPLDVLICDGKFDCEDMTDEENCGNCKQDEFQCPLSKACIPSKLRCDDKADCKFQEDEANCFALSNGKEILLDLDSKPAFANAGFFSRNKNGVWRVVCSQETAFQSQGPKIAENICNLLGFKGVLYYNSTNEIILRHSIPIEPDLKKARASSKHLHTDATECCSNFMEKKQIALPVREGKQRSVFIDVMEGGCQGIYVECRTVSNMIVPMKTLCAAGILKVKSTSVPKIKVSVETHNKPNVFVHPAPNKLILKKKEEDLEKLVNNKYLLPNKTIYVKNKLHKAIEKIHWPWLVDIYINGKLWCLGVLLDKHWVMVHSSCLFGIRMNTNYVAALLGGGKSKNYLHKSHNEQIHRIDCSEPVPNSDVLLLHLETATKFSHHILPTFLPEQPEMGRTIFHECIAILHENDYGLIKTLTVLEMQNDKLCKSSDVLCFHLDEKEPSILMLQQLNLNAKELISVSEEPPLNSDDTLANRSIFAKNTTCKQFGSKNLNASPNLLEAADQGILVCREKNSGWHPKGLFEYNNTNCQSFKEAFSIRTIDKSLKAIQNIMNDSTCTLPFKAPKCSTWRCSLGECLRHGQVCDGQDDCHDGSDEDKTMCQDYKNECDSSEMKCQKSNKCIPKDKFCDHNVDCDDYSDEPTICSCFTFLRATDPSKICDGIRNCWDKSDESPAICNCTENHFRCGTSEECVPQDFVCDNTIDCPEGEDEKFCFGIEHPFEQHKKFLTPVQKKPKYGQVIEQSHGLWHTKCFPKSSPPDISEIRQICLKLGYNPYHHPSYRLIDDLENEIVQIVESPDQRGRSFGSNVLIGKYRQATKAIIATKFSPLYVNDEFSLLMKPSRPTAKLIYWNATDSKNCFRLEIKCT